VSDVASDVRGRQPLLPTPVVVLWFAALVSWASGQVIGVLGLMPLPDVFGPVGSPGTDQPDPELLAQAQLISALSSLPTTIAVLLAAIGLGMLYNRRGFDRLSRTAAVSAIVMAIASALAAVAVLALLTIGPARAIGVIDLQVGVVVAVATAAASASAVVLIRPYVDPMVAHVWAGIAGAGIALPFMVAGISPALVMAGAVGIGVLDRARGARTERELARRKELEAEQAARAAALPEGAAGRGIGVRGLPGLPPVPRAPRPMLPWSEGERRASIGLGVGAVVVVALAWAGGAAAAEVGLLVAGQGFALASLGAVPLLAQAALLLRVAAASREALTVGGGLLVAASAAMLTAPVALVVLIAVLVQAVVVAVLTALLARRAVGARVGTALMLAATAAIVWLLVVLPSGALVLAFVAVATTILALRRKVHP
jgi:MFS family permease